MKEDFKLVLENERIIRGTVYASTVEEENRKPVLVICHGFKGFKDWAFFPYVAKACSEKGFITVTFNFSGNGVGDDLETFSELEKFSVNTYAQEMNDLETVLGKIQSKQLPFSDQMDQDSICLVGHSKGGADCLLMAGAHQQTIAAIATWNGVAYVDLFGEALRTEIKENGIAYIENGRTKQQMPIRKAVIDDIDENKERYDLLKIVQGVNLPYLFVQGDADRDWIVSGSKRLEAAAKHGTLHWIENGNHTFNVGHPFVTPSKELDEVIEVTTSFFNSCLRR